MLRTKLGNKAPEPQEKGGDEQEPLGLLPGAPDGSSLQLINIETTNFLVTSQSTHISCPLTVGTQIELNSSMYFYQKVLLFCINAVLSYLYP